MARIPRRIAGIGASDLPDAAAFDAYVGPAREITVDPQRNIIALHDGVTLGGKRAQVIDISAFATAAQGALAATALQPSIFVDDPDAQAAFRQLIGISDAPIGFHGVTFWDLAQTLVGDGVTDDSVAFAQAMTQAAALGITKFISSVPTKRFRVLDQTLTSPHGKLEFDLNGAAFVTDYNVANLNAQTTMFKSTNTSLRVIFRNLEIDGTNAGGTSGYGMPTFQFVGAAYVELDRVTWRGCSNRNSTPSGSVLGPPYRSALILHNVKEAYVHDSMFHGGMGEVLESINSSSNSDNWCRFRVERCYFSKTRENDPGLQWSSSSIVVYNCAKGSYVQDCVFGQHIKSAANVFGPFVIQRCTFLGVSDSQAIDFNETGVFNVDAYVVRDCFIQNVTNGWAIRGSGRNVIIENVEINRCVNGIYVQPWAGNILPQFDGVGTQRLRTMYNVWIKNIISNGADTVGSSGTTLIKIVGASPTLLATVYISGLGVQNHASADIPSSGYGFERGIEATNCNLYLEGGTFQHGTTNLVRLLGTGSLHARDCIFQGSHCTGAWINAHGATINGMSFQFCYTIGAASTFHVQVTGSPTFVGKVYFMGSQQLSQRSGIPGGNLVET